MVWAGVSLRPDGGEPAVLGTGLPPDDGGGPPPDAKDSLAAAAQVVRDAMRRAGVLHDADSKTGFKGHVTIMKTTRLSTRQRRAVRPPAPFPPRTNRTRRVLHPVLIGHAASLTPY